MVSIASIVTVFPKIGFLKQSIKSDNKLSMNLMEKTEL